MSSWESYLSLGGNEIINNARARGIAESASCPLSWFKGPYCPGLQQALQDESYTFDNIADAPWWDPDLPDVSRRFFGAFAYRIEGINDSTRTAEVVDGIEDGGRIGRVRKGSRRVKVKAILSGVGLDAIEYGQAWLSAALDPGTCGQHGDVCGTSDLAYFVDCPPTTPNVPEYGEWTEVRRNLCRYPNAEDGTTTGWTAAASAAISSSDEEAHSGTRSYKVETPGSVVQEGISQSTSATLGPESSGTTGDETCSVWVLAPEGAQLRFAIEEYVPGGAYVGPIAVVPFVGTGQWQRVSATGQKSTGANIIRSYVRTNGIAQAITFYVDDALNEAVGELDGYFDGSTPPVLDSFGGEVVRYSWSGDENESVSIEESRSTALVPMPEDQYQTQVVDPLRRYLHDVAAISGPFITNTLNVGPFWAYEVEFVLASERAHVYGVTRQVDLPATPSTVVEDIAHNLAPYPSAELDDGDPVLAARNLSTNPSVESNTTGWTAEQSLVSGQSAASYFTTGRTQERFASGTWSMRGRILGNGSTEAGGVAEVRIRQDVNITGLAAVGTRLSFNIWGAVVVESGDVPSASEIQGMEAYVEWRNGGGLISQESLGSSAEYGGHPFSVKSLDIPATSTVARVVLAAQVKWSSSATPQFNSDIRVYADALAVTIP